MFQHIRTLSAAVTSVTRQVAANAADLGPPPYTRALPFGEALATCPAKS
jgi:hypothetical protein